MALFQGYTTIMETLVVGGTDLSSKDSYGRTPLHSLVLMRTTMELPTEEAPIMTKVIEATVGAHSLAGMAALAFICLRINA